ncbi:hypothetical protein [Paracoccus ravus]|uniref:hypothetical protein n=1 Tax=Paracoccus ravus TaxID=2447760 RepID=UPI00106E8082|nr:hypothetical protein [Paracoccus ravus]
MFTPEEWQALVRAARADKSIHDRVKAAYKDLDTPGQYEEMVAELYADWSQRNREAKGPLQAAFEKIRQFFRALSAAFRGEGYQDAAEIMERIASGEIGGRGGPDGPGGNGSRAKEQRETGPFGPILRGMKETGKARHWRLKPCRMGRPPALCIILMSGLLPWFGEKRHRT